MLKLQFYFIDRSVLDKSLNTRICVQMNAVTGFLCTAEYVVTLCGEIQTDRDRYICV